MAAIHNRDLIAQARLAAIADELDDIEQAIAAAAEGRPMPWPLADVFVRIAFAAEHCERVVEDHANGERRASDETLLEVATTLRMVREVTTALVQVATAAAKRA
jgi:hypothetical protein